MKELVQERVYEGQGLQRLKELGGRRDVKRYGTPLMKEIGVLLEKLKGEIKINLSNASTTDVQRFKPQQFIS